MLMRGREDRLLAFGSWLVPGASTLVDKKNGKLCRTGSPIPWAFRQELMANGLRAKADSLMPRRLYQSSRPEVLLRRRDCELLAQDES